jgi:hypothetical protein
MTYGVTTTEHDFWTKAVFIVAREPPFFGQSSKRLMQLRATVCRLRTYEIVTMLAPRSYEFPLVPFHNLSLRHFYMQSSPTGILKV